MTGIWVAADVITAARMNEKTCIQASGATINGLTTYAGMLAFCTSTGNGFTANHLYERNAANDAWYEIPVIQTTAPTSGNIVYFDGTNYAQKAPTYEMLDNHLASGAESSYTFTPGTALSGDTYSEIIINYDLVPTAVFALQGVINAIGGGSNESWGTKTTTTAVSAINATAAAQIQLASTAICEGTRPVVGQLRLLLVQAHATRQCLGFSTFTSTAEIMEVMSHVVDVTTDTITSIKTQTSTSTWTTNSRITTYGVRRA